MSSTIASQSSIKILPSGKPVGAEIQEVDLRRISDADFAAIHRAWNDHSVLLFRGQKLTDEDLIAFSKRFGDLDWAPVQETGRRFVEGYPEIYVVSNVMVDGEPIGSLGAAKRRGTPTCRIWKSPLRRACCTRSRFLRRAAIRIFAECTTPTSRCPML
jgi:taurine dioxygenase